jgi:hypothetical protein
VARLRIYVDTSVIGGCFDPEFVTWSDALMRDFRAKRLVPVLSDVTAVEIAAAPAAVQALHKELLGLSAAYEARKILPKRFAADMTHIALATIAEVDAVVSWNFKHIVRLEKIRLFNAVNVELGYRALSILSPREVTTYEGH